jgi:hypothetical protein
MTDGQAGIPGLPTHDDTLRLPLTLDPVGRRINDRRFT